MTIVEFFDLTNKRHLHAWQILQQRGIWPAGFYTEFLAGLEFPAGWQTALAFKMANAYAKIGIHILEIAE